MSESKKNQSESVQMHVNDVTPIAWSGYKTKSEEIRARAAAGQSRSVIAKSMNIRYQHVRNVLTNPPKKQS